MPTFTKSLKSSCLIGGGNGTDIYLVIKVNNSLSFILLADLFITELLVNKFAILVYNLPPSLTLSLSLSKLLYCFSINSFSSLSLVFTSLNLSNKLSISSNLFFSTLSISLGVFSLTSSISLINLFITSLS